MPDIPGLFALGLHPLELVVRGSAVYWFLFLLFRFILRRDAGSLGIADILLLVLIADASQNAMAGAYETVTDGFLLVATIAGWNWLMDWGSFHFKAVRHFAEPPPRVLVRNGKMLRRNMRREYVTTEELLACLREQGIDKLEQVKFARMEADGQISVIRKGASRGDGVEKGPGKSTVADGVSQGQG
jgi:uncharacterized membrane protein YcaP (DUF421 family)